MRAYDELDDADLWELSTSDREAFGEIFRRHARAVFAICYWRTGDAAMAEDVTSVVFLEAWRRRDLVVLEQRSALPWLLGVANHTSRNATRSLRRYTQALKRLDGHRQLPTDDVVIDRIEAETSLKMFNGVVRDLSEQEREIVLLVFWSGLSYEATSVALGVPVGTVRSRVSRTRRKLQLRLGDNRVTKEAS
ncbi:MAG: RNA polymerase sigma factor [Acidimicrobiales bacterium]|jgi:RNA polymerase sigma-70 factor (ECF subfamily)